MASGVLGADVLRTDAIEGDQVQSSIRHSGHAMKIVFLIRDVGRGGAQRQVVALARGLATRGHTVIVATFYPGGAFEDDLTHAGVAVHSLDKRGRWDLSGFLIRLVRFLHREKPDVVHSYMGTSNILSASLKFVDRPKVVWGVRDSRADLRPYGRVSQMDAAMEARLSAFADLIVCNSQAGRDLALRRGFPNDRTVVLHNGIDPSRFAPDRTAGKRIRAEWGVEDRHRLIGLVSRLDPMKDHATFLQAASQLASRRDDIRFVCVGSGPRDYTDELRRLGARLGLSDILVWAGERGDMPAVYNALDISVSSSAFGEGFSNAISEAMACEVPCVVTDVGDSALVVGDTGRVVSPKEPVALAEAIDQTLDDLALDCTLHDRARNRVCERFSIDRLVDHTESILLDLVSH